MQPQMQFIGEEEFFEEVASMLAACFEAEVTRDGTARRALVTFSGGERFIVAVNEPD